MKGKMDVVYQLFCVRRCKGHHGWNVQTRRALVCIKRKMDIIYMPFCGLERASPISDCPISVRFNARTEVNNGVYRHRDHRMEGPSPSMRKSIANG